MKIKNFIFRTICAILILLIVIFIFRIESDKTKIDTYLDYKNSYDNHTTMMNSLMEKYNKNSTLSVERVHIINDYLDLYDERRTKIMEFENFVRDNQEFLNNAGLNSSELIGDLQFQRTVIEENIAGFESDLEKLNNSVLISYTEKQRKKYERLSERIKEY